MLTGSLFMLEVYDRVLPSRSVPTLVALLILTAGLYAAQGFIDAIRSRILVRIGHSLNESMSMRVYDAIVRLPLMIGGKGDGSQPIRDLDAVRGFLSGAGPSAFFDLPWLPVYLAICFLFHPYIGLTALGGAVILIGLTAATELRTRSPTRHATQFAAARNALMESSRRNAEAMTAMGMVGRIAKRWASLIARTSLLPAGQRRGRRPRRRLEGAAAVVAIRAAGGRRLARDPSGIHLRHHHRRIDPRQPRSGAGRSRHRQLARFRRRQAGLEPAFAPLHAPAGAGSANGAATAGKDIVVQNAAVAPPGEQKLVCQDVNFSLTAGKALKSYPTAAARRCAFRARSRAGRVSGTSWKTPLRPSCSVLIASQRSRTRPAGAASASPNT